MLAFYDLEAIEVSEKLFRRIVDVRVKTHCYLKIALFANIHNIVYLNTTYRIIVD